MDLDTLLKNRAELTHSSQSKCPVVLSTRVRLARNLAETRFPGWAEKNQREETLSACMQAMDVLPQMKRALSLRIEELSDLEKLVLYERHLISRELMGSKSGSGVVISKDQSCVIMINEEDHLRIQVLRSGLHFKRAWNTINTVDSKLENVLDYAFSTRLGYLTACPTNLGTGLRVSAMMHLPALVLSSQMDKVIRAVNQLGIAVRGLFGEGSEASGSIFQISNQTTLGEKEENIIKRLNGVLNTVIEQEMNARARVLETDRYKLYDKIGRAYGILNSGYVMSSSEAMNLLSLIRLGIDIGVFPETERALVDRLFIESQPGHIQVVAKGVADPRKRDILRADYLRREFANLPEPEFDISNNKS